MRQTKVVLKPEDREKLEVLRSKGLHHAREVNRAHILLALDRKIPEATIQSILGVGRTAVWRTRSAYREKGLEYALYDAPRPGAPRDYPTDQEARVVALACSQPPEGAKRWTVRLLTRLRGFEGLRDGSASKSRRRLKRSSLQS